MVAIHFIFNWSYLFNTITKLFVIVISEATKSSRLAFSTTQRRRFSMYRRPQVHVTNGKPESELKPISVKVPSIKEAPGGTNLSGLQVRPFSAAISHVPSERVHVVVDEEDNVPSSVEENAALGWQGGTRGSGVTAVMDYEEKLSEVDSSPRRRIPRSSSKE